MSRQHGRDAELRTLIIAEMKRSAKERAEVWLSVWSSEFRVPYPKVLIRKELNRMEEDGLVIADRSAQQDTLWKLIPSPNGFGIQEENTMGYDDRLPRVSEHQQIQEWLEEGCLSPEQVPNAPHYVQVAGSHYKARLTRKGELIECKEYAIDNEDPARNGLNVGIWTARL